MGNNFASVGLGAGAFHIREVSNERVWARNEDPAVAQTTECKIAMLTDKRSG